MDEVMSSTGEEIEQYRDDVVALIYANTSNEATSLPMIENTVWANLEELPYTGKTIGVQLVNSPAIMAASP